MMNQYYGFSGRVGRPNYDRTPYRRPMNRGGMYGGMPGGMPGNMPRQGCGCGLRNGHHDHDHHEHRDHDRHDHGTTTMIPAGGCGCGCGHSHGTETASCKHLMDQIRAVDFALYETVLYLDVYPHSCDALETYRKLKAQSEALHAEYESSCAPLTAFGNKSDSSWDWMSKPFPWEYDAD